MVIVVFDYLGVEDVNLSVENHHVLMNMDIIALQEIRKIDSPVNILIEYVNRLENSHFIHFFPQILCDFLNLFFGLHFLHLPVDVVNKRQSFLS